MTRTKGFFKTHSLLAVGLVLAFATGALGIMPVVALASTAGPNSPTVAADDASTGTISWTATGSVLTQNDTYATANLGATANVKSHYLKVTNFGFSIPASATIDGITVEADRYESGGTSLRILDSSIKIVKGGSISGTDKSTGLSWPNSDTDTYQSYGGVADLWGLGWTPADINASGFGVAISAVHDNSTSSRAAEADHVRITITYHVVDTTSPTAAVAVPGNGSIYGALTMPSSFSGLVADDVNGGGLNANSATFTLQRPGDGWYWDGVGNWQPGAIALPTTHSATTTGTTVTWTSSAVLPNWNLQPDGDYIVQPAAVDKASNSASGTPITFSLSSESVAPVVATVASPIDASIYRTATMPSTFSGQAADDASGVGLNANSTTFALQRPGDGYYWTGSAWQAGAFNLATTHSATTTGTAVTWTSSATLPTWSTQTQGVYTITAKATDKVGNTFSGTPITFTFDRVVPASASVTSPTAGNYRSADLPSAFSGVVSDDASGSGLAANSTTFTVQNPSSQYWNGSSWQSSAFSLTTTHTATSGGGATTWTSTAVLPNWATQAQGTYTLRATAIDKAGNTFTGTSVAFVLDDTAPITASVTSPANGSTLAAITVPPFFAGSAADNSGGAGLNAGSTVFTLQRPGDGYYWNGIGWQAGTFNLTANHTATTGNTAASWSSSAVLPDWNLQPDGVYTVRATATDKLGHTFTGAAITFTLNAAWPVTTSGRNPQSGLVGGSGTTWVSPSNITSPTGTPYVTCTLPAAGTTNFLLATNYGFNIPSNAVIDGIQVTINRMTSGSTSPFTSDLVVQLTKDGSTPIGSNLAVIGVDWPTSFGTASYGGTSNLWGSTWTPAQINAAGFGVVLQAADTNTSRTRDASVDYVQVAVTYHVVNPAPTVAITSPINNATLTTSTVAVSGTASSTSGVATVAVSIQRSSDSQYWTGSGWGAQTWLGVTGTTNWSGAFALTPTSQEGTPTYTINARAADSLNNTGTAPPVTGVTVQDTFHIVPTFGPNGAISPSTSQTVNYGDSATFAVTADPHYHVVDVLKDGVSIGASSSVTFVNVTANHTLSATFAIDTFTVSPSAGPNGAISPSTSQTVNYGDSATFAVTADPHYHIVDVLKDGVSIGASSSVTFEGVSANHTLSAAFAIDTYTITPSAGPNGAITPSTTQTIDYGDSATFAVVPDIGHHIVDVLKDGISIGASGSVTFANVSANHTLSATFAIDTFTITPSAGPNGAITPSTTQTIDYGSGATFAVTADPHYHVVDVVKDGVSIGASGSVTFANVTANHTLSATFAIDTFTITPSAGAHGAIAPSSAQVIDYGNSATFSVTADPHYHIVDVLKDGISIGASGSVTFEGVSADHTLSATFAIDTFTITPSAGPNGAITPSTTQTIDYGSGATFAVTADPHYHVVDVVKDGVSIGASSSVTFANVAANHTLSATFAIDTFTITPSAGAHGAISPSTTQTIDYGNSATFAITADPHYHIVDVLRDGVSIGASSSVTFANVSANHTLSATFAIDTFTITPSAGAHGAIAPSSAQVIDYGNSATFSIAPDLGYHILDVLKDGVSIGASSSVTFADVSANHTLSATFAIDRFDIVPAIIGAGTITPSTTQTVDYGSESATFTIAPSIGHHIVDVAVDGISQGPITAYKFSGVTAGHTLSATFAIDTFTITPSAGANGAISPSTVQTVDWGSGVTFSVTADPHYHILNVVKDGVSIGASSSVTFANVTANHTLSATFAIDTFTITPSAGARGTITPGSTQVIDYGSGATFAVTADPHYHIVDVLKDGVSIGASGSVTFANVTANHTLSATFAIDTFTITANASAGGTIVPFTGSQNYTYGSDITFDILPDPHYHLADVLKDGVSIGTSSSVSLSSISASHTITAIFAIDTNNIVPSAGAHGTISPSTTQTVAYGSNSATFTLSPGIGYHVADVLVDGVSQGPITAYKFSNVITGHTISATFAINTYRIVPSATGGGTITPSTTQTVDYGSDSATFTIAPSIGHHLIDVLVDGVSQGTITQYKFAGVTGNHTISAMFANNTFQIVPSAGAHGAISPSTTQTVDWGGEATFAMLPDPHYHVADVLKDGVSIGASSSVTFDNVTAAHTLSATFAIDTFQVVPSATGGGSVSPSTAQAIDYGGSATFAIAPDAHYHLAYVLKDGVSIGTSTSVTFANVTANHTVHAVFAIDTNDVVASAGANGTITPGATNAVDYGGNITFAVTPNTGYHILDVLKDGISIGASSSVTFENVTSGHTLAATFAVDTFQVVPIAGAHGTISPSTTQTVEYGCDCATFTITPASGYHVADVCIDGVSCGATGTLLLTSVTASHTVLATFEANPVFSTTTKLTGPTSVKVKKTLKLSGKVSPSSAVGKVTITMRRLVGKKWRSAGTARVAVVGGTFVYSFKPKYKGKWTFTASYSGGVVGLTTYRSSKSGIKKVTVK